MPIAAKSAVIGVVPAEQRHARTRLFDAFERAYPVRFVGRECAALGGLDAVILFPSEDEQAPPSNIPSLRYRIAERGAGAAEELLLARHSALARPLRGSRLKEAHAGGVSLRHPGEVLATVGGRPGWCVRVAAGVAHHEVAIAPPELAAGDALRSRLTPNRSLAILALAQFIQNAASELAWATPGTRAAYVIDDPNLRRPTYGHVNFAEMAASARAHGYHVSIAMVPRDGRFANSHVVRLFRQERACLSLCIHGNDHVPDELGRPRSLAESSVPAAQAIRRTVRFERRTGLTVDRVMVPPHECLGEAGAQGLLACGFEAFSGTRPYPWHGSAHDLEWLSRPADAGPLVGWGCAAIADGLPALLRIGFNYPREELVLRAFLGQPLILYGHEDLLRGGPGELEQVAADMSRLGDVNWQSLAAIARSSYTTRRRGSTMEIRMLGRRISVDVPGGVAELLVDADAVRESPTHRMRVRGGRLSEDGLAGGKCERVAVDGPGRVELALGHAVDPQTVPPPLPSIRAAARRLAAEGRDRTRKASHTLLRAA